MLSRCRVTQRYGPSRSPIICPFPPSGSEIVTSSVPVHTATIGVAGGRASSNRRPVATSHANVLVFCEPPCIDAMTADPENAVESTLAGKGSLGMVSTRR